MHVHSLINQIKYSLPRTSKLNWIKFLLEEKKKKYVKWKSRFDNETRFTFKHYLYFIIRIIESSIFNPPNAIPFTRMIVIFFFRSINSLFNFFIILKKKKIYIQKNMIDQELISFEIPSKIIQSDRNINDIFPCAWRNSYSDFNYV